MGRADRLRVNIGKTALPTSFEGVVMERLPLRCLIVGQVYRSQQNGMVYDPNGNIPMPDGWESRRGRAEDNSI